MKQRQKIEYKRALIYCRVSSDRQVNEGHGLDSQEQRCVARAQELGLEVVTIFRDEGISGKLFDRPAMQNLIKYLDRYPNENFVIIFDDISRLARDVMVHLKLKVKLVEERGARLECLNQKFEDTEEGEFLELIFAGKAQLDRKQNRRQVMQKMKSRIELGYWPFCPPPALSNQKDSIKGNILMPTEPLASIYKEAIERFRDYKLNTLEDVRSFILNKYKEYGIVKPLSLGGADRILKQLLYAGYVEYEPWGVERREGQHKGFITYETYLAVQEKLANKAKPRLRKDYSSDFPIRGYALCGECKKPMTSAWFKGNGKDKLAKYLCKTINCERKNKTIPRDIIESSFADLLNRVKPKQEVLNYIEAVLQDVWKTRHEREQSAVISNSKLISDIEGQNDLLMNRIAQSTNESLIQEYEKAITKNLIEVENLKLNSDKIKYLPNGFQTALREVLDFVENPIKQWESNDYKRRRILLSMYFDQRLTYDHNLGFQTVELPLILELSKTKITQKGHLVEMARVKLASKTNSPFHCSQD